MFGESSEDTETLWFVLFTASVSRDVRATGLLSPPPPPVLMSLALGVLRNRLSRLYLRPAGGLNAASTSSMRSCRGGASVSACTLWDKERCLCRWALVFRLWPVSVECKGFWEKKINNRGTWETATNERITSDIFHALKYLKKKQTTFWKLILLNHWWHQPNMHIFFSLDWQISFQFTS